MTFNIENIKGTAIRKELYAKFGVGMKGLQNKSNINCDKNLNGVTRNGHSKRAIDIW